MGLIIGMDEAGYGPNLGPLVVSATAWEVPGHPHDCDLWKAFTRVVSQRPADDFSHVQVADSKQVYGAGRGLAPLEHGVLCAARLADKACESFQSLCATLTAAESPEAGLGRWPHDPWLAGHDLSLPHAAPVEPIDRQAARWRQRCEAKNVRLVGLTCDIVTPRRFNALTRAAGSKGRALTEISLGVVRRLWSFDHHEPVLILADKHGGRNNYHEFLQAVVGDSLVMCHESGLQRSRYRILSSEICFDAKGERHFPVALASMVSKYVRELAMVLFNRFWVEHLPDLKPTAGYPGDARRFYDDIAEVRQRLGILDDSLWRER